MFTESEVLLTTLERLQQHRVVGLGLHDGLLIQASRAGMVKAVMREAVREIAGTDIPVNVKHVAGIDGE